MYYITYQYLPSLTLFICQIEAVAKSQRVSNKTGTHDKTLSSEPVTQTASAGNRTQVNCFEGNYAHHYTTALQTLNGTQTHDKTLSSEPVTQNCVGRELNRGQGDLPTPLTHNNTQQHYTTALGYIKLQMYQLFLWRLYLMVLRGATSLLRALEGVGPENLDFFGPKWRSLRSMPLVMMLHPQNHYIPRHKNNRYINSYYMYTYTVCRGGGGMVLWVSRQKNIKHLPQSPCRGQFFYACQPLKRLVIR